MGRTARLNAALTFGWSIAIGVLAVGCIVAAVVLWIRPKIDRVQDSGSVVAVPRVRVESRFPPPNEEEAIRIVRRVVEEEMEVSLAEKFIRKCEMSWEQVAEFLLGREASDGRVMRYDWIGGMDDNDMQIESVVVHSELDGEPVVRQAFLTPDDDGVWKVDLPSFARHVDPPWQDLFDGKEPSVLVRVFFKVDHYYNGVFRDEGEWRSYRLATSDYEGLLDGYCRVGSKQQAAMQEMLNRMAGKSRRMGFATLELRRVEGAERTQFEISRVLAEGWVVGDTFFEDRVVPVD